jgi:hypothetical protein
MEKDGDQQRQIAEEVSYEWELLRWTFATLRTQIGEKVVRDAGTPFLAVRCFFGTSLEEPRGSALLEPFLLHVRNLRDFLYCDNPSHEDDVVAVHFFDHPDDWTTRRPPMAEYLTSIRKRLNKALAHISYARLDYRSNKTWNIGQIKQDLTVPWEAFLNALPPRKRQWFHA